MDAHVLYLQVISMYQILCVTVISIFKSTIHPILSLSLKAFLARNPKDHSIEENWKFIKAGQMEMLNKKVPKKKLGTWRDIP